MSMRWLHTISLIFLIAGCVVGHRVHEQDESLDAEGMQGVSAELLGGSFVPIGVSQPKGCPALPLLSSHYLKRIYHVSFAVSAKLLTKMLSQEIPVILNSMGFEYVTVAPDAEFNFWQLSATEISMSISKVSVQYKGVSLGTDINLSLKMEMQSDIVHIKDVELDLPEDEKKVGASRMGSFWSATKNMANKAYSGAANMGIKKALAMMELKNYDRNMCKEAAGSGVRFNIRLSKLVVDDTGNLGIGVTFHDAGCNGNWKEDEAPMLDTTSKNDAMTTTRTNLLKHVDTPGLARAAVYFEDGFVEKLSGNQPLGMAVDGALKVNALNPASDFVASSSAGKALFSEIINNVLGFIGVAKSAHLSEIEAHCYRILTGNKTLFNFVPDASFVVMDVSNKGVSILESLFDDQEREALFSSPDGQKVLEQQEEIKRTMTPGECSP